MTTNKPVAFVIKKLRLYLTIVASSSAHCNKVERNIIKLFKPVIYKFLY